MKSIFAKSVNLLVFEALCLVIFLTAFGASELKAQCLPVDYQKTFERVYRQDKIFIEGLADLTGDGKPDAYGYKVLVNVYRHLVILPNDGNGGFGAPIVSGTDFDINTQSIEMDSKTYGSIVVGKINNDNSLDMAVLSNTAPNYVRIFLNDGNGNMTAAGITFLESNERLLNIADFTGDGLGDLLTGKINLNSIFYFQSFGFHVGTANNTFGNLSVFVYDNPQSPAHPFVGDFSGDGKSDIIYMKYAGNNYSLNLLTSNGNGSFTNNSLPFSNVGIYGTADLNNDGKMDIYGNSALLNNGGGTFTEIPYPTMPAEPYQTNYIYPTNKYFAADYDGDGDLDLIISKSGRQNSADLQKKFHQVLINNGQGLFTKIFKSIPFNGIAADITGDGKAENVIFVNSTLGSYYPSATNQPIVIVKQATCQALAPSGQTKILDFNGDRVSDIANWQSSNGQWSYLANVNSNSFFWGNSFDKPVPGDYDGDGKTDAAVFRNDGNWYVLQSSTGSLYALGFGFSTDIPISADYDGDGKTDIAVYRPSTGDWHIWLMGPQQYRGIHWGISEDLPVPADFDGDGKTDLAVFRPSTGFWYYFRSSDAGFGAVNWGRNNDIPIPADYDYDGKADIAVFRKAGGTWFILHSADGNYTQAAFGQDGDLPMPIDSDGDGVLELGVYRPSAFTWYSSGQPLLIWAQYGSAQTKPLRMFQPLG
ncbi:MAG TPA: VCBS repeat-containing protein [Pyrinomonadaceae bacterium]|nr:VCBS repeat-containing protein [Pyrinomonadaceae bacterium]